MKIKITKDARVIIEQLVELMETHDQQTATLSDRNTDYSAAVDLATERQSTQRMILGAANRLVKAVKH